MKGSRATFVSVLGMGVYIAALVANVWASVLPPNEYRPHFFTEPLPTRVCGYGSEDKDYSREISPDELGPVFLAKIKILGRPTQTRIFFWTAE